MTQIAGELRHEVRALQGMVTPPPKRGVADWKRGDTPAGWALGDSPDVHLRARLEALGAPALADLVLRLQRENAGLREALAAASPAAPPPLLGCPAPDHVAGSAPLLAGAGGRSPAAPSPAPPPPGPAPRLSQEPPSLPQSPSALPRQQQQLAPGAEAEGLPDGRRAPEPPQPRLLERRISRVAANVQLANQIREELVAAVGEGARGATARAPAPPRGASGGHGPKIVHSNFFLPDLSGRDPKLREFLLEKLLATSFQRHLEQNGALNWATRSGLLRPEHRLDALWTQSDGNCLLHALLLAMGALHDTQTVGSTGLSSLRFAMSRLLDGPLERRLEARWRAQLARDHAAAPPGVAPAARLPQADGGGSALFHFELTTEQLQREWAEMKAIAGRQGAFLDSVHVFALAQVLQRPVVMLAQATMKDQWGVPVTPVHFRGVYLPLECDPASCCREPLVLCFQDAHFMPLVPTEYAGRRDPVRIPLADSGGEDLPLRFALPEELAAPWQTARRYMDVEELRLFATGPPVHAALLQRRELHPLVRDMLKEFLSCGEDAFEEAETASRRAGSACGGAREDAQQSLADGCRLEDARPPPRADAAPDARPPPRAGSRPPPPRADVELDAALAASLAAEEDASASLAAGAARRAAGPQPGLLGARAPALAPPPAEEEPDAEFEQVFSVKLPPGSRPGDALTWKEFSFRVPHGYHGEDTMPLRVRQRLRGETIRQFRNVTRASRQEAVQMLTQSRGDLDRAVNCFYSS